MGWIGLRALSFLMVQKESFWDNLPSEEIWTPRDTWHPFDPFLLAEGNNLFLFFLSFFQSFFSIFLIKKFPFKGMFAAGMISSYLKLVHIFSINPYLGPLQVEFNI